MDELPEGVVGVAEAAGDLPLGQAIEEHSAEGLVLALQGTGGLLEETSARDVVHNRWPECEVIVADGPADQGNPGPGVRPGANAARGAKWPGKSVPKGQGGAPQRGKATVEGALDSRDNSRRIASHRTPYLSRKHGSREVAV